MLDTWLGDVSLLAWLARATALCLVAAIVAAAVQRRSAEVAHRVWVAALAGVVLLPLLAAVVPTWTVATRPAAPAALAVRPGPVDPPPATPSEPAAPEPAALAAAAAELPSAAAAPETSEVAPPAVLPPPATFDVDWPRVFWLAWAGVAAALLARLVGAAVLLARLVRRSPAASDELQAWVAGVAASLGVRRRFAVRVLPAGSMPMACWLGRWVVLLPADVASWPASLRWTVAAHELGHIARRDAWTDLLAQFVCRLGWPHPLLWLAARAVPRLRERACDEWVLATGRVGARDYARHLLDVVARCTTPGVALAPAMARAADLERRLRSVLAGARAPRKRLAQAATVGGAILTAVIAGAQPPADAKGNPPAVQRSAEPVPADGPAIRVAGVVVAPDGKPIGGAAVVLRAKVGGKQYAFGLRHNRDVLARTTADSEGRFALEGIVVPPRLDDVIDGLMRGQGGAELLAWADGRGLVWADVKRLADNEPVRLTLPAESAVTGVVRDEAGKGVPGVRVAVFGATRATADIDSRFHQPGDLNLTMSEVPPGVTTDAQGRFSLRHLPPDYRLLAAFERAGLTRKVVFIDTGAGADLAEIRTSGGRDRAFAVQRSPLSVDLKPQRSVTVNVVDHAGQPVADGVVQAIDAQRHFAGHGDVDGRGAARIAAGAPGRYQFSYGTDPLRPRLGTSATAEIAAGADSPVVELRLPEPRWLTGRVVDADTGKGVVGAHVGFWQGSAEPAANARAVSGPGGEFRIPVAPGRGRLSIVMGVFGYFPENFFTSAAPITEPPGLAIDVPPSGDPKPVTLPLARGLCVRGTVRDAAGKPVAGAVVQAQNDDRPHRRSAATADARGRFELSGLSPHVKTLVTVQAAGGAAQLTIDAAPDHPWDKTRWQDVEVQLEPGVALAGRVLYKGQPKTGVVMKLFRGTGGGRYPEFAASTTDAEGRYRVNGLKPGDSYYFQVVAPDGMGDPAWTHQMPYVQTVREGKAEVELPDVMMMTRGQSLRGVVVDPQGKPVAGVTVSAQLRDGQNVPRPQTGPPPWTKTDEQGRFELRQLPDQPLELMIYRAGPGGTWIRFPAVVRVAANQQDVRAVYDPTLADEVESLDPPRKK